MTAVAMLDEFQFWRDALAGKPVAIHDSTPQPGYYKLRKGRDLPFVPVAIWKKDGEFICRVGAETKNAHDVWSYCADKPITKVVAQEAFKTGAFPGDAPPVGHNSGDLSLTEQIREYAAQALTWLKKTSITNTETKDMAANYRARLLELRKTADAERETEKRPHLEASRAVDAKFKPVIEEADQAANTIRDALTAYMRQEEAKLEAERRAKYEAERAAVEAARKEADAARVKLMQDDPIAALTTPEPELPMMPVAPEPVKVQAGGQRGRKTGLRTTVRYQVSDHVKALAFFADSDDVRELIQKLADRASKAGVAVPGVERIEEKVAA